MSELHLSEKTNFKARALLVGNRLDLRALEEADSLALTPLTIEIEGGVAVLYRYGAVVLFGADPLHEAVILKRLSSLINGPYSTAELEEVNIRVNPEGREGMRGNTVFISSVDVERLQVIADILAKSVVLAQYEAKVAQNIERIEPLAIDLERHGKISGNAKEMLRHIGTMLLSEFVMVGRVSIPEKPEVLWENPALQGFYNRIEDEFEILERHTALERKLNLISQTAETLLDVLNNRHALRLEWYIIILIVAELILSLYQLFLQ
ncbi:MAG: RMD1 family protein [Burkholderiaceae bacterium]|nr:RMD1 family protein [Burkholderiaceae bacterium]